MMDSQNASHVALTTATNDNSSSLLNSINDTELPVLSARDQLLLDIERLLKIYYSVFLVALGTVFNILSILVLSRAAFRRTTTSVYLRFLACMDLFVLYNGLSRHFVAGINGYNVRDLSEGFCKFNQWSTSFAPDISAWILVAVTTERVVSIVWPHKVKVVCSKVTASVTVTTISLVIMASNIPLMVFYGDKEVVDGATNTTTVQKCVLLEPEYETFMAKIWYWLDLLKFVLLPSIILIVFNIIIITFVIRSRRRVEKVHGARNKYGGRKYTASVSSNGGTGEDSEAAGIDVRCNSMESRHTIASTTTNATVMSSSRVTGSNKEVSLTVTLVAINATFVICNTPIMVYLLGKDHWFPPDYGPEERLTVTAAVMAMYTNNAANFLLYCASGSRFRAEIRQMCAPVLHMKVRCKYKYKSGILGRSSDCVGGDSHRLSGSNPSGSDSGTCSKRSNNLERQSAACLTISGNKCSPETCTKTSCFV